MNVSFPPFVIWLLIFFVICFGALYLYVTADYDHWKKRNIPQVPPLFPFGNMWSLVRGKESIMDFYLNTYRRFVGHRYMGLIMIKEPTLLIRDPGLIKQILIKDFSQFHDRSFPVDEVNDPMSGNLFNLQGSRWHSLRNKLSPTFTSGKMKFMFSMVKACAEKLSAKTAEESEEMGGSIELKDFMSRYTTDVIGSAAFGVEAGSLDNPESEFRQIGRRVFAVTLANSFRNALVVFAPNLSSKLGVKSADPVAESFFTRVVKETVEYRDKNNVKRNDFLQLLLSLRVDAEKEGKLESSETDLTMEQLTAQCFVFFLGGFETSATTLTFTLYELSRNLDVQAKLREEVDRVLAEHGGEITYEALSQMQYMDCVISETLRKYPPVPVLLRECTKEWTVSSAEETASDSQEWTRATRGGGQVVALGTKVHIPIIGLHYDPQYFEDPERFDPERFTEEGKKRWHPFAYLPFGEGPRICIGMRFGQMQTKCGLAALLSKFEFRPSSKTSDPLVFENFALIPTVRDGLWLKPVKRS
ncbi:probable cytochrome P450 6a14 [Ischnura elegans]|uniref:probable cytochrome P450 6a14 n=1 Tax=Ischnura elegans TaxID=197161 RepID=UPI001ED87119|nr:probable cytochrome P450 6a14 [Ischnura elegans]